jgi:opacity protein-like surface antigen
LNDCLYLYQNPRLQESVICNILYLIIPMNSKLFLMAVAVVAAFCTVAAATVSPVTIATPAVAQNMSGGGNATGGNMTGGGNMSATANDQLTQ